VRQDLRVLAPPVLAPARGLSQKGPHPKLGVIGGRQSAASTSAKCALAPKTAGGMTKTVAPTTEQNKFTYAEKRTAAQHSAHITGARLPTPQPNG